MVVLMVEKVVHGMVVVELPMMIVVVLVRVVLGP